MFNLDILEVVIGLALIFLLLSLLCSGINELISQITSTRSNDLAKWVRKAIKNPDAFFNHPSIKGLTEAGRLPSYIPARSFAVALVDTTFRAGRIRTEAAASGIPSAHPTADDMEEQEWLLASLTSEATGAEEALKRIETWFDDAMDRVSGWYKRRTQILLLLIGIAVVALMNADSFSIADSLWRNEALRDSLVATAEQQVANESNSSTNGEGVENAFKAVSDDLDQVEALSVPLGWNDRPSGWESWAAKLGGLAFTAIAISFGAPFWFDALTKLANLRATGKKPKSASETT